MCRDEGSYQSKCIKAEHALKTIRDKAETIAEARIVAIAIIGETDVRYGHAPLPKGAKTEKMSLDEAERLLEEAENG